MTAAGDVVTQLMGEPGKGWAALRPQAGAGGTVWSVFKRRNLNPDEGQTIVECLATLIFEATFRIKPYRRGEKKDVPETVLGHAAAAHGTALDIAEMMWDMQRDLTAIKAKIGA